MSMPSVCSIRFGGNSTPWRSASSVAKTSITASAAVSRATRSRSGPTACHPAHCAGQRLHSSKRTLVQAHSISDSAKRGATLASISQCVWLGLLVEPEPLADLRHEAGHGGTLRPLCQEGEGGSAPALRVNRLPARPRPQEGRGRRANAPQVALKPVSTNLLAVRVERNRTYPLALFSKRLDVTPAFARDLHG
jgi:hypothetical protein